MAIPPPNVSQFLFALHTLLGQPDWKEEMRARLLQLLSEHGLTWNDLPAVLAVLSTNFASQPIPDLLTQRGLTWADMPEVFRAINATAGKVPRKLAVFRQLNQRWGQFGDSNAHVAAIARKQFDARLIKHGLAWSDWTTILIASVPPPAAAATASSSSPPEAPQINVLELALRLLEMYWVSPPAYRMVAALYALFTHVCFKYFSTAPRLGVLAPIDTSGKTRLMQLLNLMGSRPFYTDNITAAGIYRQLYFGGEQFLLLDEGDNLGLFEDKTLRATLNSGHSFIGRVTRNIDGRPRNFSTFGPLVIAANGKLPSPLLSRCVAAFNLLRPKPEEMRQLEPFDLRDPKMLAQFHASRELFEQWAATCMLSLDPSIPSELQLRHHDNWKPLLAIADNLGSGETARAAAIELCGSRAGDNSTVRALMTTRTAFETHNTDRFHNKILVEEMTTLDDFWLSYCGPKDDRAPRKLTTGGLAELLRPLGIGIKTVWPIPRRPDSKSFPGYYQYQFAEMWKRYCPPADTPTQSSKIIHLARPAPDTSGDTSSDTSQDDRKAGSGGGQS